MGKVQFLFGIHNHQPVGNFDHVFKKAFNLSYKPFVSVLEQHPLIRTTLHFSGPLLEWMESEETEFFEKIGELAEKKQVEIMSGGFYEPIFSVLREQDVLGQIGMMNDFIRQKFRTTPRGAWIAERVWDPVLPRLICDAGLSYTLLDSTHFLKTGVLPENIRGYYVTEREGKTLAIFPIDVNLRYTIPFEPPEKTTEYLCGFADNTEQDIAVTYGDDGEKFGMWPGTFSWVYEKGWLEAFFKELEKNRDKISMVTFSEYLDSHSSEGLIYLPTLSYEEMMEWALPAEAVMRYEDMLENLTDLQIKDKYSSFISGGYWNNFFVKYPESNNMHKKMLMVSEKFEEWQNSRKGAQDNGLVNSARKELYMGQCNCSYWHGLFGGIYINYLRHAIYEHLINAEKIIDSSSNGDDAWIDYKIVDFKKDRSEDILISGKNLNAFFSPGDGGGLFELDFKPCSFNVLNTMARKMEGYHRKLILENTEPDSPGDSRQPVSIHNMLKVKAEGLQDQLACDWYRRYSFIDHFLGEGTTPEAFFMSRYSEIGNFVNTPYLLENIEKDSSDPKVSFTLKKDGMVLQDDRKMPLSIEKRFSVDDSLMEIQAVYSVKNRGEKDICLWFGVEFNFTLLDSDDSLRYYCFPEHNREKLLINSKRVFSDISFFEINDDRDGFGMKFELTPESDVWMFPLETVSQSEEGLEMTYQGSTLLMHWKISIQQGKQQSRSIKLTFNKFQEENGKNIMEI